MNPSASEKLDITGRLQVLKEKLKLVPQRPGVYLHKDQRGEILYIGKANNLNARLKSYFTNLDRHSIKTQALVEKIHDFEVMIADNEYEALLLENNLIKHNKPQYNILLRDDKTYPWLKIDLNEAWPRLIKTRQQKKDGALYFGPYTDVGRMQQVLNVINRFFLLIKCTPVTFKTVTRPCNYYDIKKCLGPCKLPVDKNEYRSQVESVTAILNGKTKDVILKIKEEIKTAAMSMNYEKAAVLRDQLRALESFSSQQSITFASELDIDIIASYWHMDRITFYVAQVREGKLIGGVSFSLHNITEEPLESEENTEHNAKTEKLRVFSSFITQYYQNRLVPELVLFDDKTEILDENDLTLINKFLEEKRTPANESVKPLDQIFYSDLKNIRKKHRKFDKKNIDNIKDIVNLSYENAENKFREQMKADENQLNMLNGLKEFLNLSFLPRYIECFDISTFQGTETVASQVVFKNAKPFKEGYRKYIIKSITNRHNDDFASLREVMQRRFKEGNKTKLPDLVLIDGGTPQIREVSTILKSLALDHLFIVGIAKSRTQSHFTESRVEKSFERLVIPQRDERNELLPEKEPDVKILNPNSPEYRLVTQLRDEAHRFAITFHRKRRDKMSLLGKNERKKQ